ncbi:MAG: TraB/GumN family protein [Gammaproteobacteria bacterium AqS3]|nr:TraB/GumN family protein [Gammaproteobacteria bacterium AqS3]
MNISATTPFALLRRRSLLAWSAVLVLLMTGAPVSIGESKPALWKLSDDDSEIWLFGTVHILNPDVQWQNRQIRNAFESADTLITEAPTNEVSPQKMQRLTMRHGFSKSKRSFLKRLSPEADANLTQVLAMLGLPEEAVKASMAQMRPWLAATMITVMTIQVRGADPNAGVDSVLWNQAKAQGKTLAYLETVEDQFNIFADLEDAEEMRMFEDTVKQLAEQPDMLDALVQLWLDAEQDQLAEMMQASMSGMDSLRDAMLRKRNEDWAEQIKELMDGSGSYFIAVGAGHLAGSDSVQEILRELYDLVAKRQ